MADWYVGQDVMCWYEDDRGPYDIRHSKVKRVMKRFVELENGTKWRFNGRGYGPNALRCSWAAPRTPEREARLLKLQTHRILTRRLVRHEASLNRLCRILDPELFEPLRQIVDVLDKTFPQYASNEEDHGS